jgi:predicted CXXCH cytochrome family protein
MNTRRLLVAVITWLACLAGAAKDTCFDCHRIMEGMSLRFTNDIHYSKAISCADCHGGDSTETNQNIAMNASRGFKVRVARPGVPQFCGRCHCDTNVMGKYEPQPRVDQLAQYQTSVHGQLLAAGRKRVAECVDCHSVHDTRAVSDPLSSASPQRISKTCAKCHASTAAAFASSRHGQIFTDSRQPGCTVCHSAHDTQPASVAMLTGRTSVCIRCHQPGSPPLKLAGDMAQVLADLEAAGSGSNEALARARIAVHSLNLVAVKQAAEPLPPTTNPDAK